VYLEDLPELAASRLGDVDELRQFEQCGIAVEELVVAEKRRLPGQGFGCRERRVTTTTGSVVPLNSISRGVLLGGGMRS
jgi:hypothetical protein